MNKVIVMFALMLGMTMSAFAQETDKVNRKTECQTGNSVKLTKEAYPRMDTEGDLYHGLTRKLTFDRLIPPYGLEVTYDKTTHIIFPSAVRYVDLGSPHLIAGKADGGECYPCQGHSQEFQGGNQFLGHHRKREFLHLQREIRG